MENPDLPQEILVEIFSRIPAKSVGKCRTLSKSWKTQLSTNSFVKKHLNSRKLTIQQENLALVTQCDRLYIITSPTKNDEDFKDRSGSDRWFSVFGSCNGMLFVNTSEGWILMNPITLKKVIIPPPPPPILQLRYCDYEGVFGFGYDSCSDDYKIVEICSFKPKNGDGLVTTYVDVYYVKTGVWKRIDGCYPYGGFVPLMYGSESAAFVNGALHWLIGSKEGYRSCIAAFDLAKEVFREIPLPKEFVRQLGNDAYGGLDRESEVSVAGGCLFIIDNFGNSLTDVWIIKEYGVAESWVKFRIESWHRKWNSIAATLCYVEDEELLCLTSRGFLFACELKGGTVRKLDLGGRKKLFAGIAFVDSLVSPEGSS